MGYRNLQECVKDLEAGGKLLRINHEVDAELEAGAIQRRVYQADGPALLFTNVRGCRFPMLGNLFGTLERTRYIFRDTLKDMERLVAMKINPRAAIKDPFGFLGTLPAALHLLPKKVSSGPVMEMQTTIDQLPQLKSWPDDGGAFITLPQVYSESAAMPGLRHSNLGMYRVQLSGGKYRPNGEIGLHYQIHRGIGVHHAEALERRLPFRVNIFVGGAPSMTVAAVMPLPEGMPEISFAGLLGGHRLEMACRNGQLPIAAEADFCITGIVDPDRTLPEGPFGDHLGYYSLAHDFPVVRVERVYHRRDAIWLLRPLAGRPRKIPPSVLSSTRSPGHSSPRSFPVCGRFMPSMRQECIRFCWPWEASAMSPMPEKGNHRNCLPLPTPSWARASFPLPSTFSSVPKRIIRHWISMTFPRSFGMCWRGSTGGAISISRPAPPSILWIIREAASIPVPKW